MNNKKVIVLTGAVVVLLLMGGIWLNKKNKKPEEKISPEITLESTKMITNEASLVAPMTEEEKQTIEKTFAQEGAEMTMLKDVSGGQAVGTSWRHFDKSNFVLKVEVSNLVIMEKGFYYEGWLVSDKGFFSIGRMAAVNGQGKLYYQTTEDKSEFRGVVVTLEPEDGNAAPDKHIVEGSF
ncbi:MAG: anti-sigma factor [Patescibacteria group bacterium]|nr:anti-sigma factor [Patescibacteria group bacterium]